MRQVIEILAQISAPHFVAGIVLVDDRVTKAAPILHFMRGWSRDRENLLPGIKLEYPRCVAKAVNPKRQAAQ
jgi:hypothetical protein